VALEAADRFLLGFAFGVSAVEVGAGGGVGAGAGERDDVQRAVELAVAAAVSPVACGVARAGGDWGGAGVAREARVGREALGAGGVADDDRGGDRAAAALGEQLRAVSLDQRLELGEQRLLLLADLADPLEGRLRDAKLRAAGQLPELAGESCSALPVMCATMSGWWTASTASKSRALNASSPFVMSSNRCAVRLVVWVALGMTALLSPAAYALLVGRV
jgi:hypothetical protein